MTFSDHQLFSAAHRLERTPHLRRDRRWEEWMGGWWVVACFLRLLLSPVSNPLPPTKNTCFDRHSLLGTPPAHHPCPCTKTWPASNPTFSPLLPLFLLPHCTSIISSPHCLPTIHGAGNPLLPTLGTFWHLEKAGKEGRKGQAFGRDRDRN